MTRPQILLCKICSPSGEKNDDFPSGNPKIVLIFGGRVMTLPYSNDSQPGRNPKVFDIALAAASTRKYHFVERHTGRSTNGEQKKFTESGL